MRSRRHPQDGTGVLETPPASYSLGQHATLSPSAPSMQSSEALVRLIFSTHVLILFNRSHSNKVRGHLKVHFIDLVLVRKKARK